MKFFDEPWLEIAKLNLIDIVTASGGEPVQDPDDITDGTDPDEGL